MERVHILCQLKRHKAALRVIVIQLGDYSLAEKYCNLHYLEAGAKLIFDNLFDLYQQTKRTTVENVNFLNKYGSRLDGRGPINYLPSDLAISHIFSFVSKSLSGAISQRCRQSVVENITQSQLAREKQIISKLQQYKIVITEDSMCCICLKRISSTLFTLLPTNEVSHTYCASRNE